MDPETTAGKPAGHAMRAEFINPLMNATVQVLVTMAGVKPVPGRPRLKHDPATHSDVTGVIGMAGEGAQGTFAISFTEACILRIVSNMLGEELTELSPDIADAVGEITNMISGSARAEFDRLGFSFKMALPTVITRRRHQMSVISSEPTIIVPFTTDSGPFFTESCFRLGS